jgi:hypothetical protein
MADPRWLAFLPISQHKKLASRQPRILGHPIKTNRLPCKHENPGRFLDGAR